MRELADADRTRSFMRALGREADAEGVCYLTGGATAVLLGWRDTTIDVDILLEPEPKALLRAVQRLKDELHIMSSSPPPPTSSRFPTGGGNAAHWRRARGS